MNFILKLISFVSEIMMILIIFISDNIHFQI